MAAEMQHAATVYNDIFHALRQRDDCLSPTIVLAELPTELAQGLVVLLVVLKILYMHILAGHYTVSLHSSPESFTLKMTGRPLITVVAGSMQGNIAIISSQTMLVLRNKVHYPT